MLVISDKSAVMVWRVETDMGRNFQSFYLFQLATCLFTVAIFNLLELSSRCHHLK